MGGGYKSARMRDSTINIYNVDIKIKRNNDLEPINYVKKFNNIISKYFII